jgi:hypothetical protein
VILVPFHQISFVILIHDAFEGMGDVLTNDILGALGIIMKNNIWVFTDTKFSASNPHSTLMRFSFNWGLPLKGYSTRNDRIQEQTAMTREFLYKYRASLNDLRTQVSNVSVFYGGDLMTEDEILSTIYKDATFALASLAVVFVLMWIHMESLALSFAALFQIALSFPTFVDPVSVPLRLATIF